MFAPLQLPHSGGRAVIHCKRNFCWTPHNFTNGHVKVEPKKTFPMSKTKRCRDLDESSRAEMKFSISPFVYCFQFSIAHNF